MVVFDVGLLTITAREDLSCQDAWDDEGFVHRREVSIIVVFHVRRRNAIAIAIAVAISIRVRANDIDIDRTQLHCYGCSMQHAACSSFCGGERETSVVRRRRTICFRLSRKEWA